MNFEIHIKEDHNLWNYLFFIGYLKNKDQTEFTGIESYVIDQIQAGEINWFPKFKCLCMTGSDENNKGDGLSQLESISVNQTEIQHNLEEMKSHLNEI